ncbi:pyridoxal-phosphate dependent enzyme [Solwaraspora sp. WMMD792]|nr:pyridoxal-phosphate dependent enzyme [Solwaraspora sp. WMMD792]MDG4769755.1 pyridoxal-phosphate dependent enzyme [Solwaraspora sp. WMMD792]
MTDTAPTSPAQARHPYSPVRQTPAGLVFVSGQLGIADGALAPGGIAAETRQALANLRDKLASAGLDFSHLVKVTVYLASMDDRNAMDAIYHETLPEPRPARTCIAVAELPYRARVELDAIAVRDGQRPGAASRTAVETASGLAVTIGDVVAARTRIAGDVVRTPLLQATWAPGDLWLKAENLQPTGAFKLRGALNAIGRHDPQVRARGVLTHSSGNHGQAVAWAARAAGVPAVIVMPRTATEVKVAATRALGAEIISVAADQRDLTTADLRARRGLTVIPPYDHVDVIAGQGTLAIEILDDLADIDTVLVPVGGGGLISGVGVVVRARSPRTRVVGVEPELAADARDSLASRRRVEWDAGATSRSVADGTRASVLGEVTFPLIQATVDEIVTVSEDQILDAVATLACRGHLVAEPSGALSTAAYLADPHRYGRTVAIVSGGNIDPALLSRALARSP